MKDVLNQKWLQPVKMARIIFHWSAGGHKASPVDREHYHFIVEGDGTLVKGDMDIADNVSTADGRYAAHTLGCNTGSISVSLACMLNATEVPFNPGKFPMTRAQWDVGVLAGAQLAKFYGIPIMPKFVLSHAEVQGTLGIKQRGKWDFTRLAFDPSVKGAKACGDRLRAEIAAAQR